MAWKRMRRLKKWRIRGWRRGFFTKASATRAKRGLKLRGKVYKVR